MTLAQSKDGVGGGHNGRSAPRHRKREVRSRIFRELVHIAAEQGASIPLGVSTGDALQECLDRAVALWRFAASRVDLLDVAEDPNVAASEDGFFEVISNPQGPDLVTTNRWYVMEREARLEIEKLAAMMTQLGIAERVVRVEEAKAALLIAAVRQAAIDAGLEHDQVRLLGESLRRQLEADSNQSQQPSRQTRIPVRGTVAAGSEPSATMRQIERGLDDDGDAAH